MSQLFLALLGLSTGMIGLYFNHKICRASNGNESSLISFYSLGLPSFLQCSLALIFGIMAFFSPPVFVFWVLLVLYAVCLIPVVCFLLMYLQYYLTAGWLPQLYGELAFVCSDCANENSSRWGDACDKCGSKDLIACRSRRTFDWRKPRTWRKRREYSSLGNSGFGTSNTWYGPGMPEGSQYTAGKWLGQEGLALPRKIAKLCKSTS